METLTIFFAIVATAIITFLATVCWISNIESKPNFYQTCMDSCTNVCMTECKK